MKFAKSTLTYFFKHIYLILLFVLPTTIFYAFLIAPKTFSFLRDFRTLPVDGIGVVFKQMFSFHYLAIIYSILFCLLLAVSLVLMLSTIEYHMRTGRLNIFRGITNAKKYIAPVLIVATIIIAVYFLLSFFTVALFFLFHSITSSSGAKISGIGYTISMISYFFIMAAFVAFALFFIMSILSSAVLNNSFRRSMQVTAYTFDGVFLQYYGQALLTVVVFFAPLYFIPNFYLSQLLIAFMFSFVGGLLVVQTAVAFFEQNNLKRTDTLEGYFKKW